MQKCTLLALQHVIKTLAARRLANYRKIFYDITTSIFVYIARLWVGHLEAGLTQISSGEGGEVAVTELEMSRVCLKSESGCKCQSVFLKPISV